MREKQHVYTVDEGRHLYWQAIARWDEVRSDSMSTWTQMGDAAHEVAAARRVWEAAVIREKGVQGTPSQRKARASLQVDSELPEELKNAR